MASRCRSISRPATSLLASASRSSPRPPLRNPLPSPSPSASFRRAPPALLVLAQSLLPLHSAVSAARLTSRLGIDACSRSLSQDGT